MSETLQKIFIVGLGGFAGANARYWLGMWVSQKWGSAFPWSTFLINVSGSFFLGFLIVFLMAKAPTAEMQNLRLLMAVGFLGAYTTFSTFEYETLSLTQSGAIGRAFFNALGSLIAGFVAVYLGEAAAKSFLR